MPPSSTSTLTGSPLMDLPAELREMATNTGALIQVCSQLRRENIDYFYTQNIFRLQVNRTTLPIALKWLTARGSTHFQQIPLLVVKFLTDDVIQEWREEMKMAETAGDLDRVLYLERHRGRHPHYGGFIVIPWATEFTPQVAKDFAQALVATGVDPNRVCVDSTRKREEARFATHIPKTFYVGMQHELRLSRAG
ncbi:hypothetical protein LTR10_003353 [Elasticomyces elasticus]|nr:hypothetical protein LTR10_003353 [Elasticomyces elasticus]KAK4969621.1 hypothetical protein LTR42_008893 [Elasticomyces elasticus]